MVRDCAIVAIRHPIVRSACRFVYRHEQFFAFAAPRSCLETYIFAGVLSQDSNRTSHRMFTAVSLEEWGHRVRFVAVTVVTCTLVGLAAWFLDRKSTRLNSSHRT